MPSLSRLLLAAILSSTLALGACGGSDPEDVVGDCASIGTTEIGTITATTPQGSFRSSCGVVQTSNGTLLITVRTPGDDSPLGNEAFLFLIDGITPGTYAIDGTTLNSIEYGRTPAATSEAVSGTVVITSATGGFAGTFEFVTATGAEVTNGRFDLDV